MDPYIERPDIWRDFHGSLICGLRAALNSILRPRFGALIQDRLYVLLGITQDEDREPILTIVELAKGNRVVTVIDVLSPEDKSPGFGRESYLKCRRDFLAARTNLVEVNLLRAGKPTMSIPAEKLPLLATGYYVGVTRVDPPQHEVYAFSMQQRLPCVSIPVASECADLTLDLQTAFTECWNNGPYPELSQYDRPPPGKLSPDELTWCDEMLRKAGFRGSSEM